MDEKQYDFDIVLKTTTTIKGLSKEDARENVKSYWEKHHNISLNDDEIFGE